MKPIIKKSWYNMFQNAIFYRKKIYHGAIFCLQTFVKLTGSGRFEPTSLDSAKGWIRAARLASDCHTGNVRIQRGRRKGCVALRAVRSISAGEELQLWFCEELLAALRIPSYLTPANIQGMQPN